MACVSIASVDKRCAVMAIHYQSLALSTHARVYVYTIRVYEEKAQSFYMNPSVTTKITSNSLTVSSCSLTATHSEFLLPHSYS